MTKGARPLAFAALLCVSAVAGAQEREALTRLSGFWMAKFVDEPRGQALIDELPEGAHLLVDTFSVPELPIGDFGGLKVTPRVLELRRRRAARAVRGVRAAVGHVRDAGAVSDGGSRDGRAHCLQDGIL
jgi:hypothetical protein